MPNKELVDYIKKLHKKGIHSDKIKAVLLNAGHDLKRVEEAILHVHYRNNITKIMIVIAIFVLLVALILIEATKSPVQEVVEADAWSGASPVSESNSEYGFDTDAYDMLITEAVQLKRIEFCDQIDREDIKEKCKEFVVKE